MCLLKFKVTVLSAGAGNYSRLAASWLVDAPVLCVRFRVNQAHLEGCKGMNFANVLLQRAASVDYTYPSKSSQLVHEGAHL